MSPGPPPFSKSRYAAGLQCARRLWLQSHAPGHAAPRDASDAARLELGREVGRLARSLFAPGALVDEPPERHAEAVARTRTLLGDSSVAAIFEGAFEHQGVRVRTDVLERLGEGAFGLREVKSSTQVRQEHLDDVAIQLFVLRGAGLEVVSVEVVHPDAGYVRGAEDIDWARFFTRRDVTREAELLVSDIPAQLREMHAAEGRDAEPDVEPSPACRRPVLCEFWEHCTRGKPEDWIGQLPGLRAGQFHGLWERGVERIPQIPEGFPLSGRQARARAAHLEGGEHVAPGLARALERSGPPAAYLDFETTSPGIPVFRGTRPYQVLPFQWSLHRADAAGGIAHAEFLAEGGKDPRRAFAESLLAALSGDDLPILVYSRYESEVLADLGEALPDLAPGLDALRRRLVDLLPVVRGSIYSRRFGGSFSLKRVVSALVPGFGYADLPGIADGGQAALAIGRLVDGALTPEQAEPLRTALRAYCKRDTEALVELHRALRARCT